MPVDVHYIYMLYIFSYFFLDICSPKIKLINQWQSSPSLNVFTSKAPGAKGRASYFCDVACSLGLKKAAEASRHTAAGWWMIPY